MKLGVINARHLKYRSYIDLPQEPPTNANSAAWQLAHAVFSLDIAAVQHLLYDVGVSPDLKNEDDFDRSPFISLTKIGAMGNSHQRSYIFNLLRGTQSWLSGYMSPPMPTKLTSVRINDIATALTDSIASVAEWLLRAGADVNAADRGLNSPLHYTAYYGLAGLAQILLDNGAHVNVRC